MEDMSNQGGQGNFVLDKTKCDECIHKEVCIYHIERKQPKMKEKKAEVFGNIVNIVECEHYRKR
jgi:hypothetical protein